MKTKLKIGNFVAIEIQERVFEYINIKCFAKTDSHRAMQTEHV